MSSKGFYVTGLGLWKAVENRWWRSDSVLRRRLNYSSRRMTKHSVKGSGQECPLHKPESQRLHPSRKVRDQDGHPAQKAGGPIPLGRRTAEAAVPTWLWLSAAFLSAGMGQSKAAARCSAGALARCHRIVRYVPVLSWTWWDSGASGVGLVSVSICFCCATSSNSCIVWEAGGRFSGGAVGLNGADALSLMRINSAGT